MFSHIFACLILKTSCMPPHPSMHLVGMKYCMHQYHHSSIEPFASADKQLFPLDKVSFFTGEGNCSLMKK